MDLAKMENRLLLLELNLYIYIANFFLPNLSFKDLARVAKVIAHKRYVVDIKKRGRHFLNQNLFLKTNLLPHLTSK